MIFMKEYWTRVDRTQKVGSLYRLVKDMFDARGHTSQFGWEDIDEFVNQRASFDYLGKHFGGALFRLGTQADYGIQSLQFFLNEEAFPAELKGDWIQPHIKACLDAWHAAESTECSRGPAFIAALKTVQAEGNTDKHEEAEVAKAIVFKEYKAVCDRKPEFYELNK